MAASPINIGSPHSLSRARQPIAISSSPSLASPSTFIRPRTTELKSGSRAQQIPHGASIGFASVNALWKSKHFEEEPTVTDDHSAKKSTAGKVKRSKTKEAMNLAAEHAVAKDKCTSMENVTGKLARPVKRRRTEEMTVKSTEQWVIDASKGAFVELQTATDQQSRTLNLERPSSRARSHSIDLSVYNFAAPETTGTALLSNDAKLVKKASKPAAKVADGQRSAGPKNPRRRAEKSGKAQGLASAQEPSESRAATDIIQADSGAAAEADIITKGQVSADLKKTAKVKTSRKRKVKSASFVLNSDDPTLDNVDSRPSAGDVTKEDRVSIRLVEGETITSCFRYRGVAAETAAPAADILHVPTTEDSTPAEHHEPPSEAVEQSAYFAAANFDAAGTGTQDAEKEGPIDVQHNTGEAIQEAVPAPNEAAPRRRLSWTPARQVVPERSQPWSRETSPSVAVSKRQLSDVIGGFGYVTNTDGRVDRAKEVADIIMPTKRRRIELTDPTSNGMAAAKQTTLIPAAEAKVPKRAKQPKKPQTITALATAAYQPAQTVRDVEVSQFFTASKEKHVQPAKDIDGQTAGLPKPKKPRKPREKATAASKADTTDQQPSKATKVKRGAKAKPNESAPSAQLLSPGRAAAELFKQDLLFGTSSQLAVDESPTFIRDMQAALLESESMRLPAYSGACGGEILGTQVVSPPKWKSCVYVPSAPHGTNLSVGQSSKDMWSETSRDFKGATLRDYREKVQRAKRERLREAQQMSAVAEVETSEGVTKAVTAQVPQALPEPSVVLPVEVEPSLQQEVMTTKEIRGHEPKTKALSSTEAKADNTWMLLGSDDSTVVPVVEGHASMRASIQSHNAEAPITLPLTSPVRRTPQARSPLRTLDRNVQLLPTNMMPEKSMALEGARHFSTTHAEKVREVQSSPTRSRRRPPKEVDLDVHPAPRPRGRPRENTADAAQPPVQSPKHAVTSASQSEWLDIDEIYDPDPPPTPSPPRRRAKSSSPVVAPLQLSPVASADLQVIAPAVVAPTIKVGDQDWLNMRDEVFKTITTTVKACPRSKDIDRPSWHQKILLYDPIVLEHFTKWLNEQGVRVEVKKQKPKPKQKGRKRKDEAVAADDVQEWEIVQEPLQAWIAQKWCEEKSVCCLWEGGMRGGVRARY